MKAARTAGSVHLRPYGSHNHRLVPLSDYQYVNKLKMMVATLKMTLERLNKLSSRIEKPCIGNIIYRMDRTRLDEAYAMQMFYAGISLKTLQSLMGYKSVSSMDAYIRVFALYVAAHYRG